MASRISLCSLFLILLLLSQILPTLQVDFGPDWMCDKIEPNGTMSVLPRETLSDDQFCDYMAPRFSMIPLFGKFKERGFHPRRHLRRYGPRRPNLSFHLDEQIRVYNGTEDFF
ncbi:hypothetical protein CRG98_026796 [Punica granatum]|uniref:Uncharacterized protein n=1 Tax=Punica granatum TaxID=22663 RepID=A0A2I0JAX4_PUNGR|nr:hypothetical protein CRG98_026796 [Punica granatum]